MATAMAQTVSHLRSHPTMRSLGYWAFQYKRTWRGSLATSFLNPALYLAAMGFGVGSFVNSSHAGVARIGGVSYLAFLAPGLLAATAMQTAAGESTFPVMGAIKWVRSYDAMLATPLRVGDVLAGHLVWMAVRTAIVSVVFFAVMLGFGAVHSPAGVLAVPAAILTGMAFAAPITAFAATQENDAGFNAIFRFVVIPLFLFSGTFFPIAQLPAALQPVAWVTPLWHGVDLCRSLSLGTASPWLTLAHVAYLSAMVAVGVVLARRSYQSRLAM